MALSRIPARQRITKFGGKSHVANRSEGERAQQGRTQQGLSPPGARWTGATKTVPVRRSRSGANWTGATRTVPVGHAGVQQGYRRGSGSAAGRAQRGQKGQKGQQGLSQSGGSPSGARWTGPTRTVPVRRPSGSLGDQATRTVPGRREVDRRNDDCPRRPSGRNDDCPRRPSGGFIMATNAVRARPLGDRNEDKRDKMGRRDNKERLSPSRGRGALRSVGDAQTRESHHCVRSVA